MSGVTSAIESILAFLESFWNWFDTTNIIGTPLGGGISFLDLAFGGFVVSLSLWLVFGFLGGDDDNV